MRTTIGNVQATFTGAHEAETLRAYWERRALSGDAFAAKMAARVGAIVAPPEGGEGLHTSPRHPVRLALTGRLLRAAETLLLHGEYVECTISCETKAEACWLLGRATRGDYGDVAVRQWYDGEEFERSVPMSHILLTPEVYDRLEAVAAAQQSRRGGRAA